jgi:hypothetical protein
MSQPPNQPYSGQPYPEQPYQGQPGYPGAGQPGYPVPGQQGYPSYPGQPNPDVPTSVPPGYPPQPAYGQQPDYGYTQPGYPQPDYAQQGYPPPGYPQSGPPMTGYPQSGPPLAGYPMPPKKKSRALPITLVSIAVVLVLCVGGSFAIYLAGRNTADNFSEDITVTTPSRGATTTEPTDPPAADITVVEPKTLGGRPKLTDPQFAGAAKQLEQGLAEVPNATETVGALYGTPTKQDIVIVAAAAAPVADPKKELDGTFLGAGVGGLEITGITTANPGTLGGSAKCGRGEAGGAPLIMCGWADKGSVGWVIWYYKSMSSAKAEFPKLRAQVEKSN